MVEELTMKKAMQIAKKVNGSEMDIAIALLEADRNGYKEASEDALKVVNNAK